MVTQRRGEDSIASHVKLVLGIASWKNTVVGLILAINLSSRMFNQIRGNKHTSLSQQSYRSSYFTSPLPRFIGWL